MHINKKWSAATAGLLALALVGGGAVSANAAPGDIVNPQPNGSPGAFFIYDGNTGQYADSDGTRVYDRAEALIIAASQDQQDLNGDGYPDGLMAEIMPGDYAAPGTYDGIYKFVAKADQIAGGENTWQAWSVTAAAGPNGGILQDDFTLQSRVQGNLGGIEGVFTQGGDWVAGIAFTTNAGVTTVGSVYRTIHVEAGTGKFTIDPVVVEGATPVVPVAEADLTPALENPALVTETADSKILAIDAGVAQANQTLSYGTFPAGLTGQVTLDANGVGTIDAAAIPYGQATKLYLAQSDNTVVAWDSFTLTQTMTTQDTTNLSATVTSSGKFSFEAPAAQTIDLGNVRRNRVSDPVALGSVSVFDDRDVLSGWNLNITSSDFAGPGGTTVAANALGYAPVGTTLVDGITAGAPKAAGEGTFGVLATADAGSATGEFEPVVIDTDLTFKAPINAAKGVHTGVLTLDLVSK